MAVLNETIELSNGVQIPKLGLGTWLMDDEEAAGAVEVALAAGYRHVDTAQAYGNEVGVGAGVRASGLPRGEVFVTTKVAAEHKTYGAAAASIEGSLEKLGLGYIDLVIIHSPQPWAEVNQSENRWYEGNRAAWAALEDAYAAGKVRAIGVSNFLSGDIENILGACRVRPMVNQVRAHAGSMPLELVRWCWGRGIVMEAYSPVGHGAVLGNGELEEIAVRYGASVPQLCIRYCLQHGMVALPKTADPAHIAANAQVDFEISPADMARMDALSITDYGAASAFPVFGGRL